MAIKIGESAPDFKGETTEGIIQFYDWLKGNWCLLITHPSEFTPVCTTELMRMASLKEEFIERNVKTIALSVNTLLSHLAWLKNRDGVEGKKINFPIIADENSEIALLYKFSSNLGKNTSSNRTAIIIDPDKKIRLTLVYPISTGRNFYELLRIIDSLQLTNNINIATPVDWHYGEDVVKLTSKNKDVT